MSKEWWEYEIYNYIPQLIIVPMMIFIWELFIELVIEPLKKGMEVWHEK